jgi:hypothetical protein
MVPGTGIGEFCMKSLITKCAILSVFTFLVLSGCRKDPAKYSGEVNKEIIGKVVDENDQVLPNVDVHYIYNVGINAEFKHVTIQYSLISQQNVTLKIYNMFGEEVSRPLENQAQLAGNHSYFFDASQLSNGIYRYRIEGNNLISEGSFLVLDDDVSALVQKPPLTLTDPDGFFHLKYATLGIGKKFTMLINNEKQDLVIADSIQIILYLENYQISVNHIKIDTTRTKEKTFRLLK